MAAYYDVTPLADLLDEISRDGSGEVIRSIALRISGTRDREFLDVLRGYEALFSQFAQRIRHHGRLQDEDYADLKGLFEELQSELAKMTAVGVPSHSVNSHGRNTLQALHLLGGLQVDLENLVAALFVSPKMLTGAFSVASSMDRRSREKHIKAIATIRGDTVSADNASELNTRHVDSFVSELKQQLVTLADLPPWIEAKPLEELVIEYLPTASDFYEAGIHYYDAPAGRGRTHHILATTSVSSRRTTTVHLSMNESYRCHNWH